MTTKTKIANLAISHLGTGSPIQDFETEDTEEARAARTYYNDVSVAVLRHFPWPFAYGEVDLELVEERTTQTQRGRTYDYAYNFGKPALWRFIYKYPLNAVKMRKIFSDYRTDTRRTRVPYRLARVNNEKIIYTDRKDARAGVTLRVDNPAFFDADYVLAFSFRLAAYMAGRIAKGDSFQLRERMFQLYELELDRAREAADSEEERDREPTSEPSEFEEARL